MLLARYRTDCKSRKAENVTTDQTKGYITKSPALENHLNGMSVLVSLNSAGELTLLKGFSL